MATANRAILALVFLGTAFSHAIADQLTKSCEFKAGPINGVVITRGEHKLAVYGFGNGSKAQTTSKIDHLLLTHHRRDILSNSRGLIERGSKAIAPVAERELIETPEKYWSDFVTKRFHDYDQQSRKILTTGLKIDRWVKEGDHVEWNGITFDVLDTPGFTRGAVSYVASIDGKRIAFTGDCIYDDGQILDLYSLQDAIPEANIRGYHGHAGRMAQLITSLRKIAAKKPDLIVPVRGRVMHKPQQSINNLISRLQSIYANYLSTNALNWYFKEDRMTLCGKRVLGKNAKVELMPYSLHQDTPDWIWVQGTSRLILSDDGHGFLLDCGSPRVIEGIDKLMKQGLVEKIDGIFVTHYHDDHTNFVAEAAKKYKCPVYATTEYKDILENPSAYHMPALTHTPIPNVKAFKDGHKMKWNEFEFTFHFYPGQTYYHGAMLVKRNSDTPVFFVGDAFSPSGMDDYCLLNRNLLHKDTGYRKCMTMIRELGPKYWLINEHIPHVFRFSDKEMTYLESRYKKRIGDIAKIVPWDDPNYAVDEQWAVCYPYGSERKTSSKFEIQVRLINHSNKERTYRVTPRTRHALKLNNSSTEITLKPRGTGHVVIEGQTTSKQGAFVVTADVETEGMQFSDWVEALVVVK
jgi:glyoxylase-like metal-dependent hydrolase (beta-lactamase superfamily II)